MEYRSERLSGRLELGDITFAAGNRLVAKSFRTPGARLEMGLPDDRATLSIGGSLAGISGDDFGADPLAPPPDDGAVQGRGIAELTLALARSESTALSLRGSYFEARESADEPAQSDTRNRVLGAGTDLSLFAGRFTLANDVAWSHYKDSDNELENVEANANVARRHHADVSVWDDHGVQIGLFGSRQRIGSGYRSLEADLLTDRDTLSYGGTIDYAPVQLSFSRTAFVTNVDRDPEKSTTGEMEDAGALSFELSGGSNADQGAPEHLMPSTVSLTLSRAYAVAAHDGDLFGPVNATDEQTVTYGVGISWVQHRYSTALALHREVQTDDAKYGAKLDAYELELSPSYDSDTWRIASEFAASTTRKAGWAGAGHALSSDIDLSLEPIDLPDVALETALSWERTPTVGSDDEVYSRHVASLDFSKFLPSAAKEREAYLRTEASYERNWDAQAEPTEAAWTVSGGIKF